MGYGFVQFYKQKSLNEALKTKQFSMLDGHSIELKRSNRTLQLVQHCIIFELILNLYTFVYC